MFIDLRSSVQREKYAGATSQRLEQQVGRDKSTGATRQPIPFSQSPGYVGRVGVVKDLRRRQLEGCLVVLRARGRATFL